MKLLARNFAFIAFAGCRAEILLKNNSITSIFDSKNKMVILQKGLLPFYHHLYFTYLSQCFQILGALLFWEHLPVAVSART